MRRRYRPILIQSGNPTLENITRRSPGRRHFRQLSGSMGIPPIPLTGGVYRTCYIEPVTDTSGISTTNWTTGETGAIPSMGSSSLATNHNSIYHYYTVPSIRNSRYEVIMQPLRFTVAAPSADDGEFDFWWGGSGATSAALMYPHSLQNDEICPYPLPTDSHAEFRSGWTQLFINRVDNNSILIGTFSSGLTFGITNYDAIDPTYRVLNSKVLVHAIQKRRNGSAYDSSPILVPPYSGGPDWNMECSKGDTIELDVWYKISYQGSPSGPGVPGRGVVYRLQSVVSTGRRHPTSGYGPALFGNFSTGRSGIKFENVNFTPLHNFKEQTYRITIAGHTGYTLKDGSNGPHKMYTNHGWTMTQSNGVIVWSNPASTSFKNITFIYNEEIPHVMLDQGGTAYVSAGGSATDRWFYRPTFGASTSYRQSTTMREVLNGNGSTNADAGVVEHAPSGVFDQDGTTTFDLVKWQSGDPADGATFGAHCTAYTSPAVFVPASHVPTTITLTQVDI